MIASRTCRHAFRPKNSPAAMLQSCGSKDPSGSGQTVKGEKACKDRESLRMLHGEKGSYLALLRGGVWSIVAAAPPPPECQVYGVFSECSRM